jgi:hypothetical protein
MIRDCSDIFKLIEACMDEAREKMRDVEPLHARIAELEAALKPFAAVTDRDLELWYGLDPDPAVPDDAALITIDSSPTVGDLRAARAALKGEK